MFNLDVDVICRKNMERMKLLAPKKSPKIPQVERIARIPKKRKVDTYA